MTAAIKQGEQDSAEQNRFKAHHRATLILIE
jgi:hypothetical protein